MQIQMNLLFQQPFYSQALIYINIHKIYHKFKYTVNQRLLASANTDFLCDVYFILFFSNLQTPVYMLCHNAMISRRHELQFHVIDCSQMVDF